MEPTNRPTDPAFSAPAPAPGAQGAGPAPGGPDTGPESLPPAWNLPPAPFPVPPVLPAMAPVPTRRRRDPLTIVMVVAGFVALGGVGFAAGRVTAPAATATVGRGANGAFNFPGGSFAPGGSFTPGGADALGRIAGGVSVRGTITEVTADHITLKLANGTTISIPLDSNTTYHRQASASSSDVTSGTEVQVQLSTGGGGGGGVQPNASGAPGVGGRATGPASDVTIVGQ